MRTLGGKAWCIIGNSRNWVSVVRMIRPMCLHISLFTMTFCLWKQNGRISKRKSNENLLSSMSLELEEAWMVPKKDA